MLTPIVPKRFGLKYAPIPTLALEYEEEVTMESGGRTSLYVYRDDGTRQVHRKLHIVELPSLNSCSDTDKILQQLQRDNERFLAPDIVKETQLMRLLKQLAEHVPAALEVQESPSQGGLGQPAVLKSGDESEQLEESFIDASADEASVEVSKEQPNPDEHQQEDQRAGRFGAAEEISAHETTSTPMTEDGKPKHDTQQPTVDDTTTSNDPEVQNGKAESDDNEDERLDQEAEENAFKSESDVSEEEIQSEELEYFSEDGSDEDSF